MLPGPDLRKFQFDMLEKALPTYACVVHFASIEDLCTWRDGGDGWTALEVLCHVRDFDEVFLARVRVTLNEENGAQPLPNPNQMAIERRYNDQEPDAALAEWRRNRTQLLDTLRPLPESRWSRVALHPKRGPMSLSDQLALITWHDMNHLEQMTRVLAERRA